MKRLFLFSKTKFLSFPREKQHKKCAELLRELFKHPEKGDDLLQVYIDLCSWMDLTLNIPLDDQFHYHLRMTNQPYKEYSPLYPNNLKNWNFSDAERPRFDSEKTDPLLDIGAVFSESKMGCSAKEKTNSSGCLGIQVRTQDRSQASPWGCVHAYLDGLRSCHNVGSIVRTVEAFRLGPLHLSSDMMPYDHPLIQKVSMGAWPLVSIDHGISLDSLPRPWIALETVDKAPSWADFSYPDICTLILGNEERGVNQDLLRKCDHVVTIPLFGIKNSLNVANAFAILAAQVSKKKSNLHTL